MTEGKGPQSLYNVTAKALADVKPGAWYFGVDCLVCKKRFPIFDDQSSGQALTTFRGEGTLRVSCPHCQADRMYPVKDVVRFVQP